MVVCGAAVWTVREERAEYGFGSGELDRKGLEESAGSLSAENGGSISAESGAPAADLVSEISAETAEIASDPDSAASDAREARMDRIATLYGEITSATREFLAALAESDRHRARGPREGSGRGWHWSGGIARDR